MSEFERFSDLPIPLQKEAIREGEARLAAQLQVASAADSRALTWGGLLTAATTASLGAGLALVTKETPDYPLAILALFVSASLLVASERALSTVRPTEFCMPGNTPSHWLPSAWPCVGSDSNKEAVARREQAEALANDIARNSRAAASRAAKMRDSFSLAYHSIGFGGVGLFGIFVFRFADHFIVAS